MPTGGSGSAGSGSGKSGGASGAAGTPLQARRPKWRAPSRYAPLNEEHRAAGAATQLAGEFRAAKQEASRPPPPWRPPGRELDQTHGVTEVRARQSLQIATTPNVTGAGPEPEPARVASDWTIRDAQARQRIHGQRLGTYQPIPAPGQDGAIVGRAPSSGRDASISAAAAPQAVPQSIEERRPGELHVTHAIHEQANTSSKVSLRVSEQVPALSLPSERIEQTQHASAQGVGTEITPAISTPASIQAPLVSMDRTGTAVSANVNASAETTAKLGERRARRFAYHSSVIAQKIENKTKDKEGVEIE
jgi:hypothetical protein